MPAYLYLYLILLTLFVAGHLRQRSFERMTRDVLAGYREQIREARLDAQFANDRLDAARHDSNRATVRLAELNKALEDVRKIKLQFPPREIKPLQQLGDAQTLEHLKLQTWLHMQELQHRNTQAQGARNACLH
jgi:hypothetical protein